MCCNFNPHSPCGERLTTSRNGSPISEFQSTLPLRGATALYNAILPSVEISIHTPLAGSDRRNETFLTK